jgi:hypothetical protein
MSDDWTSVEYRECSDAINFEPQHESTIAKNIAKFDFVSLVGPHFAGKTNFAERIRRWNLSTFWNRQSINFMVGRGLGDIPERVHGALNKQEELIFKEIWHAVPDQKIMIEQVGGTRGRRKNYGAIYGKSSCLLVFDAPFLVRYKRYLEVKEGWWTQFSSMDVELQLSKSAERFVWPKFEEGWDKIYYINTCGDEGVEYLSPLLTMVER